MPRRAPWCGQGDDDGKDGDLPEDEEKDEEEDALADACQPQLGSTSLAHGKGRASDARSWRQITGFLKRLRGKALLDEIERIIEHPSTPALSVARRDADYLKNKAAHLIRTHESQEWNLHDLVHDLVLLECAGWCHLWACQSGVRH